MSKSNRNSEIEKTIKFKKDDILSPRIVIMIEIKLCGLKEPSHIEVAFNLGIKYVGLVLIQNLQDI